MKKTLAGALIALTLTSSLVAESQWYVGAEYGSGSGERTYDGSTDVDFDSSPLTLKVGKITDKFDKVEFQYTSKTLENSNDSSDTTDISEYKINFAISILSLSYEEMIIPYVEAAIGYADDEFHGGQFATHLGLGVMVNPIDHLELSLGYRLSTNIGSTDNDITYGDQHGDFILGTAYKF